MRVNSHLEPGLENPSLRFLGLWLVTLLMQSPIRLSQRKKEKLYFNM